ncbi:AfsR/SARP family transcriptional regulator [Streptomyces hoynatensis]|uniref:AfsR/SARP family transcriptional regulator n=1 Tax=Streptomyces hoynatensis TaxID=1141874 RepID=UPI001319E585|nr:BTAD domain-containing putative transcriptional regulator [Streptomyces hoynatensis]
MSGNGLAPRQAADVPAPDGAERAPHARPGVRFGVLGPMEVFAPGAGDLPVTPQAPKIRVVLGALLVRANDIVSADALIDELWGDAPPRTATTTLQVYVSQLRKLLHRADPHGGRAALVTRRPGYLLRVAPGGLDLTEFEELHARGGAAMERGDFAAAAHLERRALALWRGPLLCDTPHGTLLGSAAVRLSDLRITAVERRVRADLGLGRHGDLVAELQELATQFPMREVIHELLMVALYRSGRQADALRAFDRISRTLAEELNITPGPRLGRLHRRIRAGDPALLHPADRERLPARPPAVQLPARDPLFTGRDDVLPAVVDKLLGAAAEGGHVAVTGMAGVGKTALALAAAHRSAPLFPDGRLFLGLRSAAGEPLTAAQAVEQLLRQLGAPVPPRGGGREAQALLARLWEGRRALLLLDDVASAEQVRALLPTSLGSAALLTGRRPPAGLEGLRTVVLRVPGAREAARIFAAAAGVPAEDPAVAEVVELCGRLPRALRLAAERLRGAGAAGLAERLDADRAGLRELGRRVLLAAYEHAAVAERRAFRLLATARARPFGPAAAAAVLGIDPAAAESAAESLVAAGLLGRHDPAHGSEGPYRLHPLSQLLALEH